jgi:hypothetical protein
MKSRTAEATVFSVALLVLSSFAVGHSTAYAGAQAESQATLTKHGRLKPLSVKAFDPHELEGVWLRQSAIAYTEKNPPLTESAKATLRRAQISHGADQAPGGEYPDAGCAPLGVTAAYSEPRPFEFVVTPKRIFQFFEVQHMWREIWMDGRKPVPDADPTYLGFSTGKWEGNTLVVDTTGFNDKTWIEENYAYKHTDAFHLVERFHLIDHNNLEIDFTFDDPKAFTHPWTGIKQLYQRRPTWEIQEALCNPEDDKKFDELIGNPEVETYCEGGQVSEGKCIRPQK